MQTIGIRELKAHLSRVLRDVAAGHVYLVSDRGRVVAELRSPDAGNRVASTPEQRALARLASRGVLRVAEQPAPAYRRSPLESRAGLAKSLIDADRGE
jgi:antitoxin (DNA-binding transcriptional repressor) of toxin-antitoxin stability system